MPIHMEGKIVWYYIFSTSTLEEMTMMEKQLKEYDKEGYQKLKDWIITMINIGEKNGDPINSDFMDLFLK